MTNTDEEAKIYLEHRLTLFRIVIEKILLCILIAGIAFLGQVLLQQHESKLTIQRENQKFLLTSRESALKELRSSFNVVTRHLAKVAALEINGGASKKLIDESKMIYEQSLSEFHSIGNNFGFLFSDYFTRDISAIIYMHRAVLHPEFQIKGDMFLLFADIARHFDFSTKLALTDGDSSEILRKELSFKIQFEYWEPENFHSKGVKKFFDANYRLWQVNAKERRSDS